MTGTPRRVLEARTAEALPGGRTFNEVRDLVATALRTELGRWCWVRDVTDDWVAYDCDGPDFTERTYQRSYTMTDDGQCTFGEEVEVEVRVDYAEAPTQVTEARRFVGGRVLEAKAADATGGRIFAVRIIESGTSKNRTHYPESVLHAAASLYEGAKAFDHHRTEAELQSSTISGLVGSYRNVVAVPGGIDGDLHLLPGATQVAEALDASLVAQAAGLPPIVGISHDALCSLVPAVRDGLNVQEATAISAVLSADVVADPSAGGRATRTVAGGTGVPAPTSEEDAPVPMTIEDYLALPAEQRAQTLAGQGYTPEQIAALTAATAPTPPVPPTPTPTPTIQEPVLVGATEGVKMARDSVTARIIVREAMRTARLDERLTENVVGTLPEQISEADVVRAVEGYQRMAEGFEKVGLVPSVPHVQVTQEALDKKRERLDRTFERNFREGYSSIKEAYIDITGKHDANPWSPDFAREIVRESWAVSRMEGQGQHVRESVVSSTWGEMLGDSITRRLLALYRIGRYNDWRKIVQVVPVSDFRTQRPLRMGGYDGDLPTVNQGAPYQPLTSPIDEETPFAIEKKGGTEDITFETITNDDIGAIVRIPELLAELAASTLYRFVFVTLFSANPTIYDSVALFDAGHGNTAALALGHSSLGTVRQKMRDQGRYGVTARPLGVTPKYLIVPNELEDLAFQLSSSDRGIPTTTPGPTDVPNLHRGIEPIVVDDLTDADDWFVAADPMAVPGIQVGFLGGREEPELLVQDDPKVGAMFSSDKVTYKLRHIYGGTVIDFRAFQRATQ